MANLVRNFIKGRMNKSVDERLVPNGEYIDARNIRMGSTEDSEIGAVENTKGNERLTTLVYPPTGTALSDQATCLGSYADGANETIYWFVHDPAFTEGATGKLDLIVSFDATDSILTYHVVSIDDGGGTDTSLNFDPQYLVTGVDLVDDLLFFTDDTNPPRKINVLKGYAQPTLNVDDALLYEDLLVIKRPPLESPAILPFNNAPNAPSPDNYMEERIICFAYRYRYENGEYSATSQFSEPSYFSKPFNFTEDAFLNEGMVNATNACEVTVNTGGPLVVGYDLLFKEMDDNVIRVIQKVDKAADGIANDTTETYTFDNRKIYTILPESEILRLYDNVPRLAKAQTVMGNRLVYGNYLEGYDLVDSDGSPVNIDYDTAHIPNEAGSRPLPVTVSSQTYQFPTTNPTVGLVVNLNFGAIDNLALTQGDTISLTVQTSPTSIWTPPAGAPNESYPLTTITFGYTLPQSFASVEEMVEHSSFQNTIGTSSNIETDPTLYGDADPSIWTNKWNATYPTQGMTLNATGVDVADEPIQIVSYNNVSVVLAFPVAQYNSSHWLITAFSSASAKYVSPEYNKSLHSNRGYELGMVYMDEYGRSSTVLVSEENKVDISCINSSFANRIRATIPVQQRAPYWADRYKFVIKQDEAGYETIYSGLFFDTTDHAYFLLQGENAAKVQEGDRLILKSDEAGPIQQCRYITVLEKKALAVGEIDEAGPYPAVAGVYIKVKKSFDITNAEDKIFLFPEREASSSVDNQTYQGQGEYPVLGYAMPGVGEIPSGTQISLDMSFTRPGTGAGGGACESRNISFTRTWTADSNYSNLVEWFYGQTGVVGAIESASTPAGGSGNPDVTIDVLSAFSSNIATALTTIQPDENVNKIRLGIDPANPDIVYAVASGTKECSDLTDLFSDVTEALGNVVQTPNRTAKVTMRWSVVKFNARIVFETLPQPTLPDLWYESSDSFPITNGFHEGNVQDQTAAQSAIVDTAFFNCISYGNGVESYKIRDSITGKPILLGNRVTTVSAQDYKEIRRFADLTYSGVYNDETNVNKLNEFNLGLLNFKPLEDSYGPVEKLFARRTDILTLQEDKISYVLAGKNLLTDSTGESVVSSVPEVLGTQVARTEDYGISNNPESFAEWGPHKFFTDAKRGAVIHLFGDGTNEKLTVISESGMRSWFRDMFIEDFNTQKIGGYDPYMDEYVLANNETQLPEEEECLGCGMLQTITVGDEPQTYCVDVGNSVGPVYIDYEVLSATSGETVTVNFTYNNVGVPGGTVGDGDSGTFTLTKDVVSANDIEVLLTPSGSGPFVLNLQVNCVDSDRITIRLITLTNASDAGKTIHNQYQWSDTAYVSPQHSSLLKFLNGTTFPIVTQYTEIVGLQGGGIIPTDTATVTMLYNRFASDTYILKSSDRFRYLRSNTDYANTPAGIAQLLADIEATGPPPNIITPAGGPTVYTGQFDMDGTYTGTGEYLYLVWDYSNIEPTALCYDATRAEDACCGCTCDPTNCQEYTVFNNNVTTATFEYVECGGSTAYLTVAAKSTVTVCSDAYPVVTTGEAEYVIITLTDCDC